MAQDFPYTFYDQRSGCPNVDHHPSASLPELKQLFGRIHHSGGGDSGATALLSDHVQTYRGEFLRFEELSPVWKSCTQQQFT
eukprot:1500279-Amphidinium_carterae.1